MIVNRLGEQCVLAGVNWFGFETETHVAHGLWTRGYDEMLAQIADLGFNVIRMPYSIEAIESDEISSVNYAAGMNAELEGKRPIEVLELIVREAARNDLLVLLDLHSLKNDNHTHGLWYDDRYSEADFIAAWERVATRLGGEPNVIGADLKNEPHGPASWGDGAVTDWKAAAERAGDRVHAIAPHWLIVVEGIEGPVEGQQLGRHWWGGNLEGTPSRSRPHGLTSDWNPLRHRIPHRRPNPMGRSLSPDPTAMNPASNRTGRGSPFESRGYAGGSCRSADGSGWSGGSHHSCPGSG